MGGTLHLALWTATGMITVGCSPEGVDSGSSETGTDESGSAESGDDLPPEMTGLPSVESLGGDTLRLSWAAGTDDVTDADALRYRVYQAVSPAEVDFAAAPVADLGAGTTTVDLSGLSPSQTYAFVVRAVDELDQESTNTEAVEASPEDLAAPEFGGLDDLTANAAGGLTATWTAATDDVTGAGSLVYDVYVSESASPQNDPDAVVVTSEPGAVSVDIADLIEVTEYFAVARARDEAGNSDGNALARKATTLDVTAPTFGGVESGEVFGGTVVLSWSAASDTYNAPEELVYAIYAQEGPEVTDFSTPTLTAAGTTEYVFDTGVTSTEYSFVVRARDEAGNESDNTELVTQTTGTSLDGTPPVMSPVLVLETLSASTMSVAWDPGTDDVSPQSELVYGVWVATSPSGLDFLTAPEVLTGPGEQTALLTGLAPQTIYYVVVRAQDQGGNWSQNTNPQTELTFADTTPPDCSGLGLVATGSSSTTVELTWSAATDDVITDPADFAYRIFSASAPGDVFSGSPLATAAGTAGGSESYLATGLAPDELRYFGVQAVDGYNLSCDSTAAAGTALADTTPPVFSGIASATTLSETAVELTWPEITSDDAFTHADVLYTAYWGDAGSVFTAPAGTLVAGTGVTSVVVSGLTPDQTYAFGVRAQDPAPYDNQDTNTAEASATTLADLDPPSVPGPVLLTAATSATLDWSATPSSDPKDVTAQGDLVYEVCGGPCLGAPLSCPVGTSSFTQSCSYYVTNPVTGVFEPDAPQATAPGATSLEITGLDPGIQVYYQVRACDQSSNCSAWSPWLYGVTQVDGVPPTEGVLSSATATSPSTVDLVWTAGSDDVTVTSNLVYRVFVALAGQAFDTASPPAVGPTTAGQLSATVTGLVRETAYDFMVQSRDTAGNWSVNTTVQASATTPADVTPPGACAVTSVVANGCNDIDVTFATTTDDGVSPEQIEYLICASLAADGCVDANFAGNVVATVTGLGSAVTSHTETVDVGAPGAWNVRVRAQDDVPNLNAEATELAVTLTDSTPPVFNGPISVTANYGAAWKASLTADWSASPATDACSDDGAITYELCVYDAGVVDCDTTFTPVAAASSQTSLTVEDPDITSNTIETFFVRAIDSSGNTSAPVQAIPTKAGVSYADDVDPIFSALPNTSGGCNNNCHVTQAPTSNGNWTYDLAVNGVATCNGAFEYVVPGDSGSSLMWLHTQDPSLHPAGCLAGQMPSAGVYLPEIQNTLRDWIDQGAFNN